MCKYTGKYEHGIQNVQVLKVLVCCWSHLKMNLTLTHFHVLINEILASGVILNPVFQRHHQNCFWHPHLSPDCQLSVCRTEMFLPPASLLQLIDNSNFSFPVESKHSSSPWKKEAMIALEPQGCQLLYSVWKINPVFGAWHKNKREGIKTKQGRWWWGC